jgi:lipopolysaccharide/colanic/teichoic acid biosynthesis glycosyltransferase
LSYRGKRALDVTVAGALLVASSPVLGLAALLIRLETHGHPIYRQRRVGRHGDPFELYKPRPTVQVQVDRYTDRQRGRLDVLPGLTGWAQVQGRASLPWSERIELDLWYVEHASLALDLKILWRTVRMVLGGHGLYKGETGGWSDPPRAT